MITARGYALALLLVLSGLSLVYTGNQSFQMLFFVLLIIPVTSCFLGIYLRKRLILNEKLENRVIRRGEKARLILSVDNKSRYFISFLSVRIKKTRQNEKQLEEKQNSVLLPMKKTVMTTNLTGYHKGIYPVGVQTWKCKDIFGLFWINLRKKDEQSRPVLTVLPKAWPFDPLRKLTSELYEKDTQKAWKPGNELDAIANIREQQPGEALKRAHWKLTARLDTVMIREFENPLQEEAVIVCDLDQEQARGLPQSQYRDYFADCVTWICDVILRFGHAVNLVSWQEQGREQAQAQSIEETEPVLFLLTGLTDNGKWNSRQIILEERLRYPQARDFILVSNRLDKETVQELKASSLGGLRVWLVLLQGSTVIPPDQDPEIQSLIKSGCTVYRSHFSTYRDSIKHQVRKEASKA